MSSDDAPLLNQIPVTWLFTRSFFLSFKLLVKMTVLVFRFSVKTKFDDLYKSVSTEESRLALVDLYSTTQHNIYYDKYALYVATVLSEPVIIGAVLPNGSAAVRNCFLSYQQEHQLELHEIVEKYIKTDKVCFLNSLCCQEAF